METRREGRGRLSSIQMLPDEAQPHVDEAVKALADRKRSAEAIREELNSHLLGLGLDPISKSAFNRYSLRLSISGRKLMEKREAVKAFVREIGSKPDVNISLAISEFGKSMIYDVIERVNENDGMLAPKELAALALSYMRFTHGDLKQVQAADATVNLDNKITRREAEMVVKAAGKAAGLSKEAVAQIRRDVLGIRPKPATDESKGA